MPDIKIEIDDRAVLAALNRLLEAADNPRDGFEAVGRLSPRVRGDRRDASPV